MIGADRKAHHLDRGTLRTLHGDLLTSSARRLICASERSSGSEEVSFRGKGGGRGKRRRLRLTVMKARTALVRTSKGTEIVLNAAADGENGEL